MSPLNSPLLCIYTLKLPYPCVDLIRVLFWVYPPVQTFIFIDPTLLVIIPNPNPTLLVIIPQLRIRVKVLIIFPRFRVRFKMRIRVIESRM